LELLDDGRYALRFERRYPHQRAKVWRALTETRHLREWFVELLDYDRSQLVFADGAELTFVCRLVFTSILDGRDAAVAVVPGWHAGLDMLGVFLDGRAVDHPPLERLQGEYARALG
jgi:hypothetical protein